MDERNDADLKREIVETRNLMIKTDNQVKNVGLDVKSFERRFDALERRVRVSGLGVHVIVAIVIALAAYLASSVSEREVRRELDETRKSALQDKGDFQARIDELERKLAALTGERSKKVTASQGALAVLTELSKGQEQKAIELVAGVEEEHLSELERKLLDDRLDDVRKRAAESSYKTGKRYLDAKSEERAFNELRRSLKIAPEGRYSPQARYLLAMGLWRHGEFEEVVELTKTMLQNQTDKGLREELLFVQGSSYAHSGHREDAMRVLAEVARGSRYSNSAKSYLEALKSGAVLPTIPGFTGPASAAN